MDHTIIDISLSSPEGNEGGSNSNAWLEFVLTGRHEATRRPTMDGSSNGSVGAFPALAHWCVAPRGLQLP